jgi:hypothetical protein
VLVFLFWEFLRESSMRNGLEVSVMAGWLFFETRVYPGNEGRSDNLMVYEGL